MKSERKFDLENRLIEFSIGCIREQPSKNQGYAQEHLMKQLIRSVTSAGLNYGEVQGTESKRDFIHKLGIVLKELKESRVNLRIQIGAKLINNIAIANQSLKECNKLIAITAKSIQTARINN